MSFAVLRPGLRRQLPHLCIAYSPYRISRPTTLGFAVIARQQSASPSRATESHGESHSPAAGDADATTGQLGSMTEGSTRHASRLARRQRRIEAGLLDSKRRIDIVKTDTPSQFAKLKEVLPARDSKKLAGRKRKRKPLAKKPQEPRVKTRQEDSARRLARVAKFGKPNTFKTAKEFNTSPAKSQSTRVKARGEDGSQRMAQRAKPAAMTTSEDFQSLEIASAPDVDTEEVPEWAARKQALRTRLPDGKWRPTKRLSPSTVEGIRALYETYGDRVTLPMLSKHFDVSYEAMRRILKSKSWRPTAEQTEERQKRWERRGERIWTKLADQGVKPPKQWRMLGVGTRGPEAQVPQWRQNEWWEKHIEELLKNAADGAEAKSEEHQA